MSHWKPKGNRTQKPKSQKSKPKKSKYDQKKSFEISKLLKLHKKQFNNDKLVNLHPLFWDATFTLKQLLDKIMRAKLQIKKHQTQSQNYHTSDNYVAHIENMNPKWDNRTIWQTGHPIIQESLTKNMTILDATSALIATRLYIDALKKVIEWCNSDMKLIVTNAIENYKTYLGKVNEIVTKREWCPDEFQKIPQKFSDKNTLAIDIKDFLDIISVYEHSLINRFNSLELIDVLSFDLSQSYVIENNDKSFKKLLIARKYHKSARPKNELNEKVQKVIDGLYLQINEDRMRLCQSLQRIRARRQVVKEYVNDEKLNIKKMQFKSLFVRIKHGIIQKQKRDLERDIADLKDTDVDKEMEDREKEAKQNDENRLNGIHGVNSNKNDKLSKISNISIHIDNSEENVWNFNQDCQIFHHFVWDKPKQE